MKAFLIKISNEFNEVTQSNKSDKSKESYALKAGQNLTEDDMLLLIEEEDEPPVRISTISPKKLNDNEKSRGKRTISPLKDKGHHHPCKNQKSETKPEAEDVHISKLRQKSQLVEAVTSSTKSSSSSYSLCEDTLLILGDYFQHEIPLLDEDPPEQKEEEKVREKLLEDVNHHEFIQEDEEEYVEDDTIDGIQHILDDNDADVDFKNNDIQADLENHTHQENAGDEDTTSHIGRAVQEPEIEQRHPEIYDLTVNEELSQSSANELNIEEENQLHQNLQEDENVLRPVVVNDGPDGYLREYETMLSNHVNELQYHTDYIEENSFEDNQLKGEIYTQKPDDLQVVSDADNNDDPEDDTAADAIAVKYDESMEVTYEDTKKKEKRENVMVKPPMRKETSQILNRFYCIQCDRDFSTKTNLNRHMLSHQGNKPHVCPECSKSFSQKATLKQHMYTHTGEKPYVCNVCNRGFTQCKSLIFHMRRHTGEKPFQCEYCLVFFRQKDALRVTTTVKCSPKNLVY